MTGIFFIVPSLLLSITSLAMDPPLDPVLEGIFFELNKKFESFKGEGDLLIECLRTDATPEQGANLIKALADYLQTSPDIEPLRANLKRAIQQLPKKNLEFDQERDREAARFLAAILYAEESFIFLAPILSRYEHSIKINFSEAMGQNKAVSFYLLFIVNDLICKAMPPPNPEPKTWRISLSKSKKPKETDIVRSNLTQVAKLLQRYGATEKKLISQSTITDEIEERLVVIKSKLIHKCDPTIPSP